jgi:hypothetical protein
MNEYILMSKHLIKPVLCKIWIPSWIWNYWRHLSLHSLLLPNCNFFLVYYVTTYFKIILRFLLPCDLLTRQ